MKSDDNSYHMLDIYYVSDLCSLCVCERERKQERRERETGGR